MGLDRVGNRLLHSQPHDGARPITVGDADLAALRLRQLPDSVEPEANAAETAPIACLALNEAIKYPLPVRRPDADTLVPNGDDDAGAVGPRLNGDLAAFRRVLERVLQQLAKDDVGRHRVPVRLWQGRDLGRIRDV